MTLEIPTPTIEELVSEWHKAKLDEEMAKKARIIIEERLIADTAILSMLGEAKSKTLSELGIKVSRTVREKWDEAKLNSLRDRINPEFFPFDEKVKLQPNRAKLNAIRDMHPDLYHEITDALTTEGEKISISKTAKD